jgi:hypothetical protein
MYSLVQINGLIVDRANTTGYRLHAGVANSQCYFGLDNAPKDASGLDAQCVYAFLGIWYKFLLTSLFSLTDCNQAYIGKRSARSGK